MWAKMTHILLFSYDPLVENLLESRGSGRIQIGEKPPRGGNPPFSVQNDNPANCSQKKITLGIEAPSDGNILIVGSTPLTTVVRRCMIRTP